jgi:hypothetical protein
MTEITKGINDLEALFSHDGRRYKFNTENMKRNLADGAGNPIYTVEVRDEFDRRGTATLGADWTVQRIVLDTAFTLRNRIAQAKENYFNAYGELNWKWRDEGLPYAIMDYESSIGLSDFTEDDWQVCDENGWKRAEVEELCRED